MSVLIEAYNLVVRNAAIARCYPGGLEGFRRAVPNRTLCTDGQLSRVGFMVLEDLLEFAAMHEGKGLTHLVERQAIDMAIVDPQQGVHAYCPWLNVARHEGGYAHAWLVGWPPGPTASPPGVDLENYAASRVEFAVEGEILPAEGGVSPDAGVQEYLHVPTGRRVYVARVHSGPGEASRARVEAVRRRAAELEGEADAARRSNDLEPTLWTIKLNDRPIKYKGFGIAVTGEKEFFVDYKEPATLGRSTPSEVEA